MPQLIICGSCNISIPRRGPSQKYCESCSAKRDIERKRLWARKHPPTKTKITEWGRNKRTTEKDAGKQFSGKETISHYFKPPDLLWSVRIIVPFTYALSKNHIYTRTRQGHVALRKEAKSCRYEISLRMKQALKEVSVVHNKIWVSIFVEKPNHKGDAVNVVDLVCDAIKDVTHDDRLYSIRQLDWAINKNDPKLIIEIGQDVDWDGSVCSCCGRLLPLAEFNKNRSNKLGVARACRDCRKMATKLRKRG